MKKTILAAAALAFLMGAPAFAQTAAPAPAKPAAATPAPAKAAPAKAAPKARSQESLDCSKQADAKGLHGKERKKFRADCMKAAKKS